MNSGSCGALALVKTSRWTVAPSDGYPAVTARRNGSRARAQWNEIAVSRCNPGWGGEFTEAHEAGAGSWP